MVPLLIGLLAGLVADRAWWESKADKYERGLEFFEHYHWGLVAWIAAYFTPLFFSFFLWGFGAALVIAEWSQIGDWSDGVWRRGHPFAYGSTHFASSTVIGVLLAAVLVATPFLLGL
ncbi:MAG: hypothetical protein QXE50_06025 [Nitrososphaerota archaeon]